MIYMWLAPAVFALALALTGLLRRYALARRMIDIPNARSSHTIPTPRGGGVAIVISFLVALLVLASVGKLSFPVTYALVGSGCGVAVLGFLDDHGHIAARWRLLGHFSASIWALFWLGGLPPITFLGNTFNLVWIGHIFAAFYLVWMLNLYNFMDGIDGIASVEALCACLGACLIYWKLDFESLLWPPLLLSMAVIGFLCWNFPPAKIFMGDAGSGFLGFTLAGLSLQAAWNDSRLLWVWLILLGVFIVDATFTLVRRLLRGDRVYEAHRSHGYQFASRKFGSHLPVTLGVVAINILWLFPIACLVAFLRLDGALGLVIAYVPLCMLASRFQAGALEK